MFKERYRQLFETINPREALISSTIHAAENRSAGRMSRRLRPALILAAICLCGTLSLPVMAAVEPLYQAMYQISPGAAQFFKPVSLTDEDNGIRMEVLSASIHGEVAEIYVTLRDLTQNRVDATTDLFDSYSINTPFDCTATCRQVQFDRDTGTATFFIQITQTGNQKITGDKITFTLREFLSGKQRYSGPIDQIALDDLSQSAAVSEPVDIRGFSGTVPEQYLKSFMPLLRNTPGIGVLDGISVTAVGIVENQLRIQVFYEDILRTDNHGFVSLRDAAGRQISCTGSVSFWDEQRCGSYEESFFEIPAQLDGCRVEGEFWSSSTLTQGAWQVTFPLGED